MSSCNYGNSADTVSIDFVKEQCPEAFETFNQTLSDADVSFDDFCYVEHSQQEYETDEEYQELIESAWEALQKAFDEKTGLELGAVYYDAEERSDELDGGAFKVDGVYGYTAAGEKFKDKIEHKEWTTFG